MPTQDESITSPVIRQVKLDGRTFSFWRVASLKIISDHIKLGLFIPLCGLQQNKRKQKKTRKNNLI